MAKFKVAYIDESQIDRRKFRRYAHNHFDVVALAPDKDLETTVEVIMENHVDAVIADFDLKNEDPTIHYTGADLVSSVLDKREHFPVFIFTSFEQDALLEGEDVNLVYEKSEIESGNKFLDRVRAQIEKYRTRINETEHRLLVLLEESKSRELTAPEEDELAALDAFIERSLDNGSIIPNRVRAKSESHDLSQLLEKVDKLTKKLANKG